MATTCPEVLTAAAEEHVKKLEDLEEFYFGADREVKLSQLADTIFATIDKAASQASTAAAPARELHVRGLFLKGRAASLVTGREATAESLLSKALKLNPKMLVAWNALGEVFWNLRNYRKARESFEQAIEFCGANSVSCRNLSMVLRAINDDDEATSLAKAKDYEKALERAKEAVTLDTADPRNWETLGNAYMGEFFVSLKRPDELNRALVAYEKAERLYDALGKQNPSLQLNRGMAAKYIENYELAMRSFSKASTLGAAAGLAEAERVYELVRRISAAVERKCDLKTKHFRELTAAMKHEEQGCCSLRELRASEKKAEELPLLARVINIIDRQGEMPVVAICSDATGDFFCLSLYNTESSKLADAVVPLRSLLKIEKAKFREIKLSGPCGQNFSYPCVRIAHPGDITVVGIGKLTRLSVQSVFSARAERVDYNKPKAETPSWEKRNEGNSQSLSQGTQENGVDSVDERWIVQEDAKMRKKEAHAKAKAKAKSKSLTKTKRRDRDRGSLSAKHRFQSRASSGSEIADEKAPSEVDDDETGVEDDTTWATESDEQNSKDDQCGSSEGDAGQQKSRQKVRWADLELSDSEVEDEFFRRGCHKPSMLTAAAAVPAC